MGYIREKTWLIEETSGASSCSCSDVVEISREGKQRKVDSVGLIQRTKNGATCAGDYLTYSITYLIKDFFQPMGIIVNVIAF